MLENKNTNGGTAQAPTLGKNGSKQAHNTLSKDVRIRGTIEFDDDLIVDADIEGEIVSEGNLMVGEKARIKGDIKTNAVLVCGKILGNIDVKQRCILKASSLVTGDIKAELVTIEEGAKFTGQIIMPETETKTPDRQSSSSDLLGTNGSREQAA